MRHNYVQALDKLISRGVYVGIATHDEFLACAASALVDRHGLKPDRYEFQMLLGVDEELRRILIDAGHGLRVYAPAPTGTPSTAPAREPRGRPGWLKAMMAGKWARKEIPVGKMSPGLTLLVTR